MSLRFLGRVTVAAALMIPLIPAPAQAAALGVTVSCEALGRYRALCERTVTGGTAPFTTKWYHQGVYYAVHDNKTFAGFPCAIPGPNTYLAVVTDATGASASGTSGVACVSGNP